MSTPNRQIGWSQESNLLSYISKQLDRLNGVVAATAAGGVLNPTTNYIPYNVGLSFGDSFLLNDATNSVLKTVYSSSDVGLNLDFANEIYSLSSGIYASSIKLQGAQTIIGDALSLTNGTQFGVDDVNEYLFASANLLVGTSGSSSGQYLKINIGGNDYKIALLNP